VYRADLPRSFLIGNKRYQLFFEFSSTYNGYVGRTIYCGCRERVVAEIHLVSESQADTSAFLHLLLDFEAILELLLQIPCHLAALHTIQNRVIVCVVV